MGWFDAKLDFRIGTARISGLATVSSQRSFEVKPEQVTYLDDGRLRVRLAMERDVTKPTHIRRSRRLSKRFLNQFESLMALPLFATLLIASLMMLALPRFGEAIGTASLFESILDWARQSFSQFSESLF
jgi:hypothetical protein